MIGAVGDGVSGLAVEDRIAALSYKSYSECDVAEAEAVAPLPASLAGQPVPGEPLGLLAPGAYTPARTP